MLPFARVAIIGMGLIGSSLARAVREAMPTVHLTVSDASAAVRERVAELGIADDVADGAGAAVVDADLVILCVPVGAMAEVAAEIGPELAPDTVVSDVGSVKESVLKVLGAAPARRARDPRPPGGRHRKIRAGCRLFQPVQGPLVHHHAAAAR